MIKSKKQIQSSIKRSINFISTGFIHTQNESIPAKTTKLTTARSVYLTTIDYVRNLTLFITDKLAKKNKHVETNVLEESICIRKPVGRESEKPTHLDFLRFQE